MKIGDLIDLVVMDKLCPLEAIATPLPDKNIFLCVFENCFPANIHCMNEARTSKYGYEASYMRRYVAGLAEFVSEKFLEHYEMIPFDNGDKFRLLTVDEVFGKNHYPYFDVMVKDYPVNLIATFNELDPITWWLQDAVDPDTFACVSSQGNLRDNYADFTLGVRPVCLLKEKECSVKPTKPEHTPDNFISDIVDSVSSRLDPITKELTLYASGDRLTKGLTYEWNILTDTETITVVSTEPEVVLSSDITLILLASWDTRISVRVMKS